jgi:hypothetical protein
MVKGISPFHVRFYGFEVIPSFCYCSDILIFIEFLCSFYRGRPCFIATYKSPILHSQFFSVPRKNTLYLPSPFCLLLFLLSFFLDYIS